MQIAAPSLRQVLGHGIGLEVRALHLIAEVQHHLGDAAHAGAADADEMDGIDATHARARHAGGIRAAQLKPHPRRRRRAPARRRHRPGPGPHAAWPARARARPWPAAGRGRRTVARSSAASRFARQLALGDHHRGAVVHQDRGVAGLVIVGRRRERHQNCADAGGREFRDGQCAGATDHQVSPAVGGRHVFDERLQPRAHAGLGVVAPRRLDPALAGLVLHFELAASPLRAPARMAPSHSGASRPGCRPPPAGGSDHGAARSAATAAAARRSHAAPDCPPPAHAAAAAKLPGKAVSTRRARRARQRLVKPAIAFCS